MPQSDGSLKAAPEDRRCPRCDAQPVLVHQMLDSRNGKTVRMFECKCGEKTWSEQGPLH
jgi:hypothetical protein